MAPNKLKKIASDGTVTKLEISAEITEEMMTTDNPDFSKMPGLVEGRIVHYVLPDGPYAGQHRPAIIVRTWDSTLGYVNLQVFADGANDGPQYATCPTWVTSVLYSEEPLPRTWHWIEKS